MVSRLRNTPRVCLRLHFLALFDLCKRYQYRDVMQVNMYKKM